VVFLLWIFALLFGVVEVLILLSTPSPTVAGIFVGYNGLLASILGIMFGMVHEQDVRENKIAAGSSDDDNAAAVADVRNEPSCWCNFLNPWRFVIYVISQHIWHYGALIAHSEELVVNKLLWIIYVPLSPLLCVVIVIVLNNTLKRYYELKLELQSSLSRKTDKFEPCPC